jgi:HEAT repeat protein
VTRPTLSVLCILLVCTGFEWPGRLARLQYDLAHGQVAARREAVKRLGMYSADEVREPLLAALEDDDAQVRKSAAASIGRVQLKDAAPLLAAWLGDRDGEIRIAAVMTLGALAEPSSREPLTRALSDALPAVRREAATALARVADDEALLALQTASTDADPTVREAAVTALRGRADGRALPALSARVRDESASVRAAVLLTLGSLADARALPLLARAAESEHDEVELAAVVALPVLRKKLTTEARVAKAAIAAIGRLQTPPALAALVETLASPELALAAQSALAERVRRGAGTKQGKDDQAQLMAASSQALANASAEEVSVIADLVQAVADIMPTAALQPALVAALEQGRGDPAKLSRAIAATASPDALLPLLERLTQLAPTSELPSVIARAQEQSRRGGSSTLTLASAQFDPANRRALLANVQPALASSAARVTAGVESLAEGTDSASRAQPDATPLDRLLAALLQYAAAAPGDGRATDPLLAQLPAATKPSTRVSIIQLLGWAAAPRALPALQKELAHPSLDVRLAAIDAVGRIGSPDALPSLTPLLQAPRPEVRLAAAAAWAQVAREAELVPVLDMLAGDAAADRFALLRAAGLTLGRLRTAHTLSEPTTKSALEIIGGLVSDPSLEVSSNALDALRRFGDDGATRWIAREIISPKLSRRAAATLAMSDFPGDETRRLLRFVLQRSSPRASVAALLALGEIGDQRDVAGIARTARASHWPLPAAATYALRRIAEKPDIKKRALERTLCELISLRDPYARANLASALAVLGGNGCPDVDLTSWYAATEPSVVRAAAARFMRARAEQNPDDPQLTQLLAACSNDPDPLVSAACSPTRKSEPSRPIDVVALGGDSHSPLRQRLIALRFSDASAFVGYTDANARVLLSHAPAGPVHLQNPGE